MAVLRERFYRTWKDALPLTDASKTEIVTRGDFSAAEGAVLRKHSVLVMDNAGLDAAQLSAIDSMLSLIPSTLHDLGAIGVVEFLGRFPPEIGWWDFFDGKGGEINIFGVRINAATENPFPAGVPAAKTATFCACLAHEVNHIVDAFGVAGNAAWSTRKQALLQAAGNDHLNYLRSMFADGFFAKAPQEYFASIANQWFTDSARTLQLGLAQFDNGRRDPINQALFYGEVYSQGGNSTCFYTTDADGHIKRSDVPLQRDPQGRITALKVNGTLYTFVLDGNGNVTSYTRKGP
jgi:hypothetical protein